MWISPAYEREYREWIADGQFDELRARQHEQLTDAIREQHPALIATSLRAFATCYHTRGIVALLERQTAGWHDIQAGYWAELYALRFEIIACTLPAWSSGRSFYHSAELAITFGFSRLFQQDADRRWLAQALERHYEIGSQIKDGQPGSKLLNAVTSTSIGYTREELLVDRRACCKTRDAYPRRPTEVIPIGVLDLETLLHYPSDAAFDYSSTPFQPTDDDQITDAIVAYHVMYP